MKSNNYKLHTHINYNFSLEVLLKKKKKLEEYYRIKVDMSGFSKKQKKLM